MDLDKFDIDKYDRTNGYILSMNFDHIDYSKLLYKGNSKVKAKQIIYQAYYKAKSNLEKQYKKLINKIDPL